MAKSITKSGACTVSAKPCDKVRGGKGFEARYQAMLAAQAKHAAIYCGPASYTICGMAIGRGAASEHTAAVSVWQGCGCRDGVTKYVPQRFVSEAERSAAVNPCR